MKKSLNLKAIIMGLILSIAMSATVMDDAEAHEAETNVFEQSNDELFSDDFESNNRIILKSITDTAHFSADSVYYNMTLYLDAIVFSPTGNYGDYTFKRITGYGATYNQYAVTHIDIDEQYAYIHTDDRSQCTVVIKGYPVDRYGNVVGSYQTVTVTFSA